MKVNIYYGGRGVIDDPSLYVLNRMTAVFKELNVKTEQFNLFEKKGEIPSLTATLKDADGVILATTIEWFGLGGNLQQLLDAFWLYGDKDKIKTLYMLPVVMSTTHGERQGMMDLMNAWELLGGLPADGLCGYIPETAKLEHDKGLIGLIEKRAENLYRTINQKIPAMPSSNQAVRQKVSIMKSSDLTPQETEQLSRYVSDDKYVETQKKDIKDLTEKFRTKMDASIITAPSEDIMERLSKKFHASPDIHAKYMIEITEPPGKQPIVLEVNAVDCKCSLGAVTDADMTVTLTADILEEITAGRTTFQGAFMKGDLKAKGDFKVLRGMDVVFP
ncbi:MAG: SCP2 sterol-binding domain-containing protein [Lachnospiraceae bacterium]|nr:SCP2 sterol-binding domain-containing protein [Lachnospiraceae bacterium]